MLHGIDPTPARAVELAVLVVASTAATVTRFVALRSWVFAAPADGSQENSQLSVDNG